MVSLGLDATYNAIVPLGMVWTSTGLATETVTVNVSPTFDNGAGTNFQITFTTNTTQNPTFTELVNFVTDGHYLVGAGIKAKSSISSSAAQVTMTLFGQNAT